MLRLVRNSYPRKIWPSSIHSSMGFFQAEDGIRVLLVTGVQTCALPICNLGYGDTTARGDMPGDMGANLPFVDVGVPVDALASGYSHTCALAGGAVKCWGRNDSGQLGYGD